jgi:hypothetical protein
VEPPTHASLLAAETAARDPNRFRLANVLTRETMVQSPMTRVHLQPKLVPKTHSLAVWPDGGGSTGSVAAHGGGGGGGGAGTGSTSPSKPLPSYRTHTPLVTRRDGVSGGGAVGAPGSLSVGGTGSLVGSDGVVLAEASVESMFDDEFSGVHNDLDDDAGHEGAGSAARGDGVDRGAAATSSPVLGKGQALTKWGEVIQIDKPEPPPVDRGKIVRYLSSQLQEPPAPGMVARAAMPPRLPTATETLVLRGNTSLTTSLIRAAALLMSPRLLRCDLSDSNVDDTMMASFLPAADALHTLVVAGCNNLTNHFLRAVALRCNETLTALDVSRNPNVNSNGIAWLAGDASCAPCCHRRCAHPNAAPLVVALAPQVAWAAPSSRASVCAV